MRLTTDQTATIAACVHRVFGPEAQILVYGSVLDERARGGDVDLLVMTTDRPTRRQRAQATLELERVLNRPVDLTTAQRGVPASAWVRLVQGQAQPLEVPA
jgi:predicted nucleotidyltransferase